MNDASVNAPYKSIDKVGMPHVMHFISTMLVSFDTSHLEWLKLLPLNKNHLLHGACHFPARAKKDSKVSAQGYRIRGSVNINMSPPFAFSHWARIPSSEYKQGWYSGEYTFEFSDLEECAVHTLSHECFHFLSHSKQVGEKNTEANANWWADQWLGDFRRWVAGK